MNFTKTAALATATEIAAYDVEDDAWEYRPVHIGQDVYRIAVIDEDGHFLGFLGKEGASTTDREMFAAAQAA